MPENAGWRDVHDALTGLYDIALSAQDPHDALRAAGAYATLVKFIADCQAPDPPGVEPERLIAAGRLLLHSGDITPYGVILLERIAQEVQ
jgi:hypothetical protein